MKRKEVRFTPFNIREVGEEGTFEGYASVFDAVDSYNSRFIKGCFTRTIQHRKGVVPLLDEHGAQIGQSTSLEEDDYGLRVRGELFISTNPQEEVRAARERYVIMRRRQQRGSPQPMSFGFMVNQDTYVEGIREIKEVDLVEVSMVTVPAQPLAGVFGVRSAGEYAAITLPLNDLISDEVFAALRDIDEEVLLSREDTLRLVVLDNIHERNPEVARVLLERSLVSHGTVNLDEFSVLEARDFDEIVLAVRSDALTSAFDVLAGELPYTRSALNAAPRVPLVRVQKGEGQKVLDTLPAISFRNIPVTELSWATRSNQAVTFALADPVDTPDSEVSEAADTRAGAVLSRKNRQKIKDVSKMLGDASTLLASLVADEDDAARDDEPQETRAQPADTQLDPPALGVSQPADTRADPSALENENAGSDEIQAFLSQMLTRAEQVSLETQIYNQLTHKN
jgi:HK97 family phage prohead protease